MPPAQAPLGGAGRWLLSLLLAAALLGLSGCNVFSGSAAQGRRIVEDKPVPSGSESIAGTPPITVYDDVTQHAAVTSVEKVTIPVAAAEPSPDYLVGPGDVLFINVGGLPELGSAPATTAGGRAIGSRVDGSGHIQLPIIKSVKVGGLTTRRVQEVITERYKQFIQEPWVVVEVIEHRSQPLYLVGQFSAPNAIYMDRPINVTQALAYGGGFTTQADLRSARVLRGGKIIAVDIYRLLQEGDLKQNVWLRGGDTVYVPDNIEQRVFVLGSVKAPGVVPMVHGRLTLAQAMTTANGTQNTGSAVRYIRIIRSLSPTQGELIVVDFERIVRGEAMDFNLMAGDIVYVPRSRLGSWNDTLDEVIPTLQLFSSLLQPFVQIRYLVEGDDDNN